LYYFFFKQRKVSKRSKPWWDLDCQKAIDNRMKYFKELSKNLNKFHLTQYRKASYNARNIIKKRKSANFNDFVDSLDPSSSSKNFWKIIKLFRNLEFFSTRTSPFISKMEVVEKFVDGFALFGMHNLFFCQGIPPFLKWNSNYRNWRR